QGPRSRSARRRWLLSGLLGGWGSGGLGSRWLGGPRRGLGGRWRRGAGDRRQLGLVLAGVVVRDGVHALRQRAGLGKGPPREVPNQSKPGNEHRAARIVAGTVDERVGDHLAVDVIP